MAIKRIDREYWLLKAIYDLTDRVSDNTPYGVLVNRLNDIRKLANQAISDADEAADEEAKS